MLCVSECFTETELATCGCITATQSHFPNDTLLCGIVTLTMCPLDSASVFRDCQSKCKPQCSFTKYNFEKTWTKFPSPAFKRNSRALISGGDKESNVSWEYMRGNYGDLVIYFGSLTVEQTDVYAKYEIFSASSAMGGLLGLFLGGSMMTIYEVVELLITVLKELTLKFLNFTNRSFNARRRLAVEPVQTN
ncbi:acid-sensing ion channel 2-like [Convolutriloba macropyga]|uniref:acid-sensing ion channel 2-like n=1 Tax=Convolutriloba macropyga TaxID=536237 RepID=UPI003F51C09D